MNQHSSRSHMVTGLIITAKDRKTRTVCQGKLSLVDLAGSERPDKSGAEGPQLEEAIAINVSLSHLLGTAILNVVGGKVVDYRSKKLLTHHLKDSLGANSNSPRPSCLSTSPPARGLWGRQNAPWTLRMAVPGR